MRMRAGMAVLAAALVVAGCSVTPRIEVTRFHLGQPIPGDTVVIAPAPGLDGNSLEFRSYADAVAGELARLGFRGGSPSAYRAVLRVEQTSRDGGPRRGGLSIGIGGGLGGGIGRGGFGGVGTSVAVPVGGNRASVVRMNFLGLELRRVSDNSVVWEGRAVQEVPADNVTANLGTAVPVLARALLKDFPGASGQTVMVKAQ